MMNSSRQSYSPWRGLTLQLFLMTILPLTVLLLVITVSSLSVHHRAMRALIGERDERAVRTASRAPSHTPIPIAVMTIRLYQRSMKWPMLNMMGSMLIVIILENLWF